MEVQINTMKNAKSIEVSVSEGLAILEYIYGEITAYISKVEYENFFFDVEIPPSLIRGMLVFARVDVAGDIYQISFHPYPDEIQKATIKTVH